MSAPTARRSNLFGSWSLRAKLLAAFGTVTALRVFVGGVGVWGSRTQSSASAKQSAVVPILHLAMQAKYQTADFFGFQTGAAYEIARGVTGALSDKAPNRAAFLDSYGKFEAQLAQLRAASLTGPERLQVQKAEAGLAGFKKLDGHGMALFQVGGNANIDKATKIFLYGEITPYVAIGGAMDTIVASVRARSDAAAKQSAAAGSLVETLMIALVLLGTVLSVMIGWLLARAFVRRVQGLRDAAELVASGDLTVEMQDEARDEIGQAARAFQQMVEGLRSLVGQTTQVAGTLSAASQQMAATSEEAGKAVGEIAHAVGDVAQGAEQQVRKLEVARLAAAEMAHAAEQSAGSAKDSAARASEAAELAHDGIEVVEQASESMRLLADAAGDVVAAVHGLGTKSEQIGGIVETITGTPARRTSWR